jgi:hypothetical protein
MSKRPAGMSAEELESFCLAQMRYAMIDVLTDDMNFKVGREGIKLVREAREFVERKRAENITQDVRARDALYARGKKLWARMCATFDDLPADLPFRYVAEETIKSPTPDPRMYVVFDGFTAVVEAAGKAVTYFWEAQDEAHRGWIGCPRGFLGRGARVPEDEVPIATALHAALRGGPYQLLHKLFALRAGRTSEFLEEYCADYGGLAGACPAIDITTDDVHDRIVFDGRVVCVRGSTPPADAPVPRFFDPVRSDAGFWRGLFNRAFVAKK